MLNRIEGIVIKTIDYGETNKIVTIYTREAGKITAMARGAKKPASRLAAMTLPFTIGLFLIQQGKGMGTLQQGETIHSMRLIREDIERTAYGSYILELVDKTVEAEKASTAVYDLLKYSLEAIADGGDAEAISMFAEWKLLPLTGIYPTVNKCSNCGATDGEFAFSFQQIGLLCHRCFEIDPYIIRLSPTIVRLIRTFYEVPMNQVGSISLKKETKQLIQKIVRTIYDEQTGIKFKTRSFITQLERTPLLTKKEETPNSE